MYLHWTKECGGKVNHFLFPCDSHEETQVAYLALKGLGKENTPCVLFPIISNLFSKQVNKSWLFQQWTCFKNLQAIISFLFICLSHSICCQDTDTLENDWNRLKYQFFQFISGVWSKVTSMLCRKRQSRDPSPRMYRPSNQIARIKVGSAHFCKSWICWKLMFPYVQFSILCCDNALFMVCLGSGRKPTFMCLENSHFTFWLT